MLPTGIMQSSGTTSRICPDVLCIVAAFCGQGYNGVLRSVCKEWAERVPNTPLRYAIITNKELFHWTSTTPGFDRHHCALVLAYHGRHDLMHLVPSSNVNDAIMVVDSYLAIRKDSACGKDVHNELWKRWNWSSSATDSVRGLGQSLTGSKTNWAKNFWQGLKLRLSLTGAKFREHAKVLQRLRTLNGHSDEQTMTTTEDELSRGLTQPWHLLYMDALDAAQLTPVSTTLMFVMYPQINYLHLASNVRNLADEFVLRVLETRAETRQLARFVRALATQQDISTPDVSQLGASAVVWMALALSYGNVECIRKYKCLLEADNYDMHWSCRHAIENLILTNRIHVLRDADITVSPTLHLIFAHLLQKFLARREEGYARYMCAELGLSYEPNCWPPHCHLNFFVNNTLGGDGRAAWWIAKNGRILPFEVAQAVVRIPGMRERALEFGFVFPDMEIHPIRRA